MCGCSSLLSTRDVQLRRRVRPLGKIRENGARSENFRIANRQCLGIVTEIVERGHTVARQQELQLELFHAARPSAPVGLRRSHISSACH
jgi:hypothetical protein